MPPDTEPPNANAFSYAAFFLHSVSWVDQSAVKRTIKKYSGELDDFDLL